MRIIWAQCSVRYSGRGDTRLDSFDRLIIVKDDGSVAVHSNAGVKPLNYMGAKTIISMSVNDAGQSVLHVDSSKESLAITLEKIYSDQTIGISVDGEPGLVRDGTEDHLQEWLSNNLSQAIPDLTFVSREYETGSGKVDIMAFNAVTGNHTLVEVKRVAVAKDVYQVKRYLDAFTEPEKHGILIALDVRPKARELAEKRGIQWIELSTDNVEAWKVARSQSTEVLAVEGTGKPIGLETSVTLFTEHEEETIVSDDGETESTSSLIE